MTLLGILGNGGTAGDRFHLGGIDGFCGEVELEMWSRRQET